MKLSYNLHESYMNTNQVKGFPFSKKLYSSNNISFSILSDEENYSEDDSLSTSSSGHNTNNNSQKQLSSKEEILDKVFIYLIILF